MQPLLLWIWMNKYKKADKAIATYALLHLLKVMFFFFLYFNERMSFSVVFFVQLICGFYGRIREHS